MPVGAGDPARAGEDGPAAADANRRAEIRKAEIRRFVREHHPDRGGDPAAFAEGLRALRDRHGHGHGRWQRQRPST